MLATWYEWSSDLATDCQAAERTTVVIVCVGVILTSLEWLAVRDLFAGSGALGWRVVGSRESVLKREWLSALCARVFGAAGVVVIHVVQIVLALSLAFSAKWSEGLLCVGCLAFFQLMLTYRNTAGPDGADQMTAITLVALALSRIPGASDTAHVAALAFIAGQAGLAYGVAGIAKLFGPKWRNGTAVMEILGTHGHGSRVVSDVFRRSPWLSPAATWLVVAMELVLPLALFLPLGPCIFLLFCGALFHCGAAIGMGLNNFVYAFLATYPAIVFTNQTGANVLIEAVGRLGV